MIATLKHIVIAVCIALLGVLVLKPELLQKIPMPTRATVETSSGVLDAVWQLVPSQFVSYLNPVIESPHTAGDKKDALTTDAIIDATNNERIKAGLMPLRSNVALIASAKVKTDDMIARQYFEHDSPDGKQVWDLVVDEGYQYIIVGENLARGDFDDAEDLLTEWMNSPGHRANVLSPKYQQIGAYIGRGVYENREVWFAVQHFGTDRSACPIIDSKLKSVIDGLDKDLTARRAQIANEKAFLISANNLEGEAYKEKVNEFNALVAQYNTILVISQEKIKTFNAQVAAFNACLSEYKPVR